MTLLLALLAPSHAWDTLSDETWAGPYNTGNGNEHPDIAQDALRVVGGADAAARFGANGAGVEDFTVIDLNASLFRREWMIDTNGNQTHGDDPATAFEERRIPGIAMFAGLPDWSFTVYDWINKNDKRFCPPLPNDADAVVRCHNYGNGWLGAGFNTSHWGELAVKMYDRHHAIATDEAAEAAAMDELFQRGGVTGDLPDGRRFHAKYTREREVEALIYEMAGQHFLEDRWSDGHMFSRWGPSAYERLSVRDGDRRFVDAAAMAMITGLIHGSQAVFDHPDPVASPLQDEDWYDDEKWHPMTWRYAHANPLWQAKTVHNGVGDYFYDEMNAGRWTAPDDQRVLLYTRDQAQVLRTCGTQGIRDVITRFAATSRGRGQLGIAVSAPGRFDGLLPVATQDGWNPAANPVCTDGWITNDTFYHGLDTIAGQPELAGDTWRIVWEMVFGTDSDNPELPAVHVGSAMMYLRWKALANVLRDQGATMPDHPAHVEPEERSGVIYGVQSAKIGFSFQAAPDPFTASLDKVAWLPNTHDPVPDWVEPPALDDLPDIDADEGRDKQAVYGFFNQAHTDWWCDGMIGRLDDMRRKIAEEEPGVERDRDIAVCGYLAERVRKRTDEDYDGPRTEILGERQGDDSGTFGAAFEPVCAYYDADRSLRVTGDDDVPYEYHPGYVETPGLIGDNGELTFDSAENWCRETPVIDFEPSPDPDPPVGTIDHLDGDRWLELTGRHFGFRTPHHIAGKVTMYDHDDAPHVLDIWDGPAHAETGGWSSDDFSLWARVPASGDGFPSAARVGMPPEQISAAEPVRYRLELARPDEDGADGIFHADGEPTVGTYEVEVEPSWTALYDVQIDGKVCAAVWATWPARLRSSTQLLAHGLYVVADDGTTTPLSDLSERHEYFDGKHTVDDQGNEQNDGDPDLVSLVTCQAVGQPFPAGYDDHLVYFFSYH
jgi:hypothetical protein